MINLLGHKYYTEEDLRKMGFKSLGIDIRIGTKATIRDPSIVTIGNHVAIDDFVMIAPTTDIGNYVHISRFTSIAGPIECYCKLDDFSGISERCSLICGSEDYSGDHLTNPTIPHKFRKIITGKIIMEKYSLLGTNVVVAPNVIIGEGTAVGACSFVNKTLAPWGIYFGIPAIRKKERSKKMIEAAKQLEGI